MTLKQKQAAMLKRHKKNRPWDHVKRRQHAKRHYSLLQAIDSGLSDEKLCLIYKLSPSYVKWFRDVEYVLWRQRIRESLKRLDFYLTVKHGRTKPTSTSTFKGERFYGFDTGTNNPLV